MNNTKLLQVFQDCQDQKISIFKAIEVIEPQLIDLIHDLQQIQTIIEFDELYNESVLIINDYIKTHKVSSSTRYMYELHSYIYSYLLKYVINNGAPFKLSLTQCKTFLTQNNIVLKHKNLLPGFLKESETDVSQDIVISLSSQLNNLSDIIHDGVFDNINYVEMCSTLDSVLATLTEKERNVLILRFGLNDNVSHTLTEIGTIIGVGPERIRQIEANALRRLRYPIRAKQIKIFLF